MLYGTYENSFGLVQHEGSDKCRNCGTTFKYRLVGGMKPGFLGFLRGTRDTEYSRIEYWDINVPDTPALSTYLQTLYNTIHNR